MPIPNLLFSPYKQFARKIKKCILENSKASSKGDLDAGD